MSGLREMELMDKILEVRYTDLEEEKKLCLQLLDVAEAEQYTYGSAFANVYLMDSFLALGEYASCDFYLSRSVYLCRENGFDDLLATLCNFAGLYYLKLNDEQTALEYFLEGLKMARRLNDFVMSSKLNNNIGLAFAGRDGWTTARQFFDKAYREMRIHLTDEYKQMFISYVVNLSEAYKELGDVEKEKETLDILDGLTISDLYTKIRIGCGWCSYYAMKGDREEAVAKIEELFDLGMQEYENTYFVRDMLVGLSENMLQIKEYSWIGKIIEILEELGKDAPLIIRYRTQRMQIQYLEAIDDQEKLPQAYEEYYKIVKEMDLMDSQVRAQSMLSRIQLETSLKERENIKAEKAVLENASQIDELTRLYNRRHLNKLISKSIQSKDVTTVGIIMIDVDYFKQYNDTYGHFQGDTALKEVASVLKENVTEGIYAGRYGGDEFMVVCIDVSDAEVENYVEAIYRGLKEIAILHEKSRCCNQLTASIGYCNVEAKDSQDVDRILQLADEALYKVKAEGRNGYRQS